MKICDVCHKHKARHELAVTIPISNNDDTTRVVIIYFCHKCWKNHDLQQIDRIASKNKSL